MCQSTSTMRRVIFDALFSDFFSRNFFITDFNETSKEQEKEFQFLNLFRKLSTSSRQNEETFSWRRREFAFKAICLQRFARREHHFSFSSFLSLFLFFFFFFSLFIFIFSLFLSLLEKVRVEHVLRASTIRDVDALFSFDEKARIDRDVETRTFEKASRNVINIFIDVSFRWSLRNVDL
jgi:hypothetical protein